MAHIFVGSQALTNNHNTDILYPPTPLSSSLVVRQYTEECTIGKKTSRIIVREKIRLLKD